LRVAFDGSLQLGPDQVDVGCCDDGSILVKRVPGGEWAASDPVVGDTPTDCATDRAHGANVGAERAWRR